MQNGILRLVLTFGFVITEQLTSASADAQAINLTDLGPGTVGHAINSSGQVALDQGIYSNGTITPLPPVPGGSTPAAALAINASGQAAGSAISPVVVGTDPIAYINGSLIDLGSLILTGTLANQGGGAATGINSSGVVVGWYVQNLIDALSVAFTYSNGTVTRLPAFPCITFNPNCSGQTNGSGPRAFGINDSGEIVGSVSYLLGFSSNNVCGSATDAFSYSNGGWSDFGPGTAYAVNAGGQITVRSRSSRIHLRWVYAKPWGPSHSSIHGHDAPNSARSLEAPNSTGYAINATGQVVGSSDFTGSTATHAFLI